MLNIFDPNKAGNFLLSYLITTAVPLCFLFILVISPNCIIDATVNKYATFCVFPLELWLQLMTVSYIDIWPTCVLIDGRLVSSALLEEGLLHLRWLDLFFWCSEDGQSIDYVLRLVIGSKLPSCEAAPLTAIIG